MPYSPPSASAFRDRLSHEKMNQTRNELGEADEVWNTLASDIAASVEPQKGGEQIQALRLSGVNPFIITVRGSSMTENIAALDRLVNQRSSEVYTVKWVQPLDEHRRYLTIHAEEGAVK